MKKLILTLFSVLIFTGCAKSLLPCEENNTFSMEFTNGTDDPYNLYINDEFQEVVAAKTKITYNIPAGFWNAKVVQKSGYVFTPTVKTYSNTYEACTKYYIVF
ncbi:MAG: hypothetical protein QM800_12815 [Paludibacter sp.]